ncbi:MAG TPA: hypothetical protein VK272_03540 [Solirubrobacteraceae bacterium]|nr:hypothetical protein [Solirubrobacteraceae bacterium]
MASSGKKKTTMAKLTRESKLRERRLDKQARKDARKNAPAQDPELVDAPGAMSSESAATVDGEPGLEAAVQAMTREEALVMQGARTITELPADPPPRAVA